MKPRAAGDCPVQPVIDKSALSHSGLPQVIAGNSAPTPDGCFLQNCCKEYSKQQNQVFFWLICAHNSSFAVARCWHNVLDVLATEHQKFKKLPENVEADIRSSQETCSENGRLLAVAFDCKVFNKKQIRKWKLSRGSIRHSGSACSALSVRHEPDGECCILDNSLKIRLKGWLKKYLMYFVCALRLITNSAVQVLITWGELRNFKSFVINVSDKASAEH